MGAFAAMSNCDMASLVIVFNPQVDLTRSSLRPGASVETHMSARDNLQKRLLSCKTQIIVNTALDEHLVQLEDLCEQQPTRLTLLVHPFLPNAGLSRHLHSAGVLSGIVYNLLHMHCYVPTGRFVFK